MQKAVCTELIYMFKNVIISSMKKRFFIFTLVIIALVVPMGSAQAFTYEKNLIITDREGTNTNYLSVGGIQRFLEDKGSVLASMSVTTDSGAKRAVSKVIKTVAERYNINPMVLLVMAQKESSAITTSTLTYPIEHWVMAYGRCDSCSEEDAAPYKGMQKQFNWAARGLRGYLDDISERGYSVSGWGPGITKTTTDGLSVTPDNAFTAALYTYNPCVGAYGGGYENFGCNSAFQKLWQDWNPNTIFYPNGSLLQSGGVVYVIQDGKKRAFTSRSALIANYDTRRIITVPSIALEQYKSGVNITLPNYSLVRNPAGTIYLIVGDTRRGIASQEAFRSNGFNPEEVLDVRWGVINAYTEGRPITAATTFQPGTLLRNSDTGATFVIGAAGRKKAIWDKTILENNYFARPITDVSPAEINSVVDGQPEKLKEGTLVRGKKAVFVISNGKKRPFDSADTFEQYGYTWDTVIEVPKKVLQLHETGKSITVKAKKKKKGTVKKKKKK